jgi:transposase
MLLVRRAIWTWVGVCLSLTNCCGSWAGPVGSGEPWNHTETVVELLKANVEMATIHSRLVREHGYRGSYSSVKRFVRRLRPKTPDVCLRIETPPGREAQVDFGGVGKIRDRATGKQAYCFVMTLSYSRHQYAELVFDQKMETWIGCHRRAFEFFGGVPEEIVIDNLKAAVLRADLDNPTRVPYTRLARHYGFLVHPCRVRTPEHKGKVRRSLCAAQLHRGQGVRGHRGSKP